MGLTLVLSSLLVLSCLHGATSDSPRNFTSMFALGDSYIDTGNFVIMAAPIMPVWQNNTPYGMTFDGHPTGRLSDGKVIVDFIAEQFGLPLLPASLLKNISDVSKGVSFAVGGATAIDVDFYVRNNLLPFTPLNSSLNVQLGWLEELKPSICNTTEVCRDYFSKSLFFVGEFGVNDYNFVWGAGKNETQVMTYVPQVVDNIVKAVERLIIKEGAKYVVVPGNPPIGCSPTILALRSSLNETKNYDHIGCLSNINRVAMYHNSKLHESIGDLRGKYPHASIIFADFYKPIMSILQNPNGFGVADADALRACCGGGGEYNWNPTAVCGMPGVNACTDPSAFVSWDGIHYTEATYQYIAEGWLHGPFADPPILNAIRH